MGYNTKETGNYLIISSYTGTRVSKVCAAKWGPHMFVFCNATRGFLCAGLILALLSCASGPPPRDESELALERAMRLANEGNLEGAAAIYWQQAGYNTTPERENLKLRAIETVLTPATRETAKRYLGELDESKFVASLLVRKRIVEAKLAMLFDRPALAVKALPPSLDGLDPKLTPEVQRVRARALLASGEIFASVKTRMALSDRLIDPLQRQDNQSRIWESLALADPQQLLRWDKQTTDGILKGWLELSYISKTAPAELAGLQQLLNDWRQRFRQHPADPRFVTLIMEDWRSLQVQPAKIAVLLPFSGPYAKVAEAIISGITAAYYSDNNRAESTTLNYYDLGATQADVKEIYARAINEGAEVILGPLNKKNLAELAGMDELPVPVLSLNYLDDSTHPPENLFQFGLLPEDEARQVAERAALDEHNHAIIFVPEGAWGTRLLDAFRERFDELGGTILATERFLSNEADYSYAIKRALLLDESDKRFKAIKANVNLDVKFEPRRRQDVEFIFIGASPRQARLLRPQFKFHYAADLPVYATSHIYSGIANASADKDLDGVRYCDIPWVLIEENPAPELSERLSVFFPQTNDQLPRLVALGFDAYNLIPYMKFLAARPFERYSGLTGNLSVDDTRRVHRQLKWARFVKGEPQSMGDAEVPLGELGAQR